MLMHFSFNILFLFLLILTIVSILCGLNKLYHNIFKIKYKPNIFKSRVCNYVCEK